MTHREVLEYIDRGANYYVSLFGRAEHMELVEREFYSFVRPKGGVYGIRFAYDLRLDGLPKERQKALIAEIKALGMPVWLNLTASQQVIRLYTDREGVGAPPEQDPDGEVYLAMLAGEKPDCPAEARVAQVHTLADFAQWAGVVNQVLSYGKADIHPEYHYPLCRDGLLRCYLVRDGEGRAVSTAAAAVDREAVSLEFVATLPEYRRRGLARAACRRAVADAFSGGAAIATVRAVDGVAAKLYESIGFTRC